MAAKSGHSGWHGACVMQSSKDAEWPCVLGKGIRLGSEIRLSSVTGVPEIHIGIDLGYRQKEWFC